MNTVSRLLSMEKKTQLPSIPTPETISTGNRTTTQHLQSPCRQTGQNMVYITKLHSYIGKLHWGDRGYDCLYQQILKAKVLALLVKLRFIWR